MQYRLVEIKKAQVDRNQMTVVRLSDFVSILLRYKRIDNDDLDSPILFLHNDILEFLKEFDKFLNPSEVVLMCIRAQKFRLTL